MARVVFDHRIIIGWVGLGGGVSPTPFSLTVFRLILCNTSSNRISSVFRLSVPETLFLLLLLSEGVGLHGPFTSLSSLLPFKCVQTKINK